MTYRLREKRSTLAVWSVRLAALSVPVLVIAAIGHRQDRIDATATYGAMAVGFGLAFLAVLAAIGAFEAIWRDGRKGSRSALGGLLLGLAVLSIPAVGAWKVVTYPQLTDISTDTDDPPAFVNVLAVRGADARPLAPLSEDEIEEQREAYPDIVSRHFAVDPARVFDEAHTLVVARGWQIVGEKRPEEAEDIGTIEAVAITPIFGFRQDVAIRVAPDGEGALVDMRSASRNGAHDLGANAERIRGFFAALDASLQGITE
jgi:uncharacterized protein (DUF1499 family)